MESDQLTRQLKVSAQQALGQCGYPTMPKNFYSKLHNKAHELAREVHYKIISTGRAFDEIKDYAFGEFSKIYQQDY